MKKILLLTALFALLFGFKAEAKTPAYVEFGMFYSSLSPHGSWLELEPGFVVWRPTIMKRWAPYNSGRWIWTEYGWYWDSYEPFGHITYHYGRWYYDDYYGWLWVPDYEWAPAWVEWRYDDNYVGWAPLPPYATFSIGIGIVFTNSYHTPYHHWHFVNYDRFCDPYPYKYYIAEKHKYRIHSRTKYRSDYDYRNGGVYNRGVDVEVVRNRSGRDVKQREIYRVNDERELRNRGDRNDDRIRTFVASRDDLRKERGNNDVRIEKSDRKSSLITSKVEIGERSNLRNENRRNESTLDNRRKDDAQIVGDDSRRKEPAGNNPQINTKRNDQDVKRKNDDIRKEPVNNRAPQVNTKRSEQEIKRPEVKNRVEQERRINNPEKRTELNTKNESSRQPNSNSVVRPKIEPRQTEVKPKNEVRQKTEFKPNVQQNRQKEQRVTTDNRNSNTELKRKSYEKPVEVKRTPVETRTNDRQKGGNQKRQR